MLVCMIKEHSRLNPDDVDMCCDLVLLLLLLLLTLSTYCNRVVAVVLSVCLSVML